jgi:hypothetical protein
MSHAAAAVRAAGTRSGYRVATGTPLQLGAHTPDALGVRCAGVRDPAVNRTMHQQPSHVAPSKLLPQATFSAWSRATSMGDGGGRLLLPSTAQATHARQPQLLLCYTSSQPPQPSLLQSDSPFDPHSLRNALPDPMCLESTLPPPTDLSTASHRHNTSPQPTPEALLTLSWTDPLLAAQTQLEPPSGQDGGFCLPQDPFHSYNGPSSAFGPFFLVAKKKEWGTEALHVYPVEREAIAATASITSPTLDSDAEETNLPPGFTRLPTTPKLAHPA